MPVKPYWSRLLLIAASAADSSLLKILVHKHGVDLSFEKGKALRTAAIFRRPENFVILWDAGVDIHASQETYLFAALEAQTDIIQFILDDCGGDIRKQRNLLHHLPKAIQYIDGTETRFGQFERLVFTCKHYNIDEVTIKNEFLKIAKEMIRKYGVCNNIARRKFLRNQLQFLLNYPDDLKKLVERAVEEDCLKDFRILFRLQMKNPEVLNEYRYDSGTAEFYEPYKEGS